MQPLPTYETAIRMADREHPKMPKIFIDGMCGDHFWDELVPYCHLPGGRSGDTTVDAKVKYELEKIIGEMPDAISYGEGNTQQVGAVSAYIGFGVTTTSAVFATPSITVGYREAGAVLPFRWSHSTGMVTLVRDEKAAAGVLEGDTLLLVADCQANIENNSSWARSPIHKERLKWREGAKVKAVWIRPGQGRMTGEVTLLANPKSYLAEMDSTQPQMTPLIVAPNGKGQAVWWFETYNID